MGKLKPLLVNLCSDRSYDQERATIDNHVIKSIWGFVRGWTPVGTPERILSRIHGQTMRAPLPRINR